MTLRTGPQPPVLLANKECPSHAGWKLTEQSTTVFDGFNEAIQDEIRRDKLADALGVMIMGQETPKKLSGEVELITALLDGTNNGSQLNMPDADWGRVWNGAGANHARNDLRKDHTSANKRKLGLHTLLAVAETHGAEIPLAVSDMVEQRNWQAAREHTTELMERESIARILPHPQMEILDLPTTESVRIGTFVPTEAGLVLAS